MECVYCAVRTQYIIQVALLYKRLSIPNALTNVPAARLLDITDTLLNITDALLNITDALLNITDAFHFHL